MKQYVIDELKPGEYQQVQAYLEEQFGPAEMGDIYWIPIDPSLYSRQQADHTECQPLYFMVHLSPGVITAELLARTRHRVRCDCMQYASDDQLIWFTRFIDSIFERLMIKT